MEAARVAAVWLAGGVLALSALYLAARLVAWAATVSSYQARRWAERREREEQREQREEGDAK